MFNIKIDYYFKLILIISLISIIIAYFIEHALGHQPCNLCLIERIPYVLSVLLVIINYMIRKNEKIFILLIILIFIFSFLISFYHFGIEQNFFNESAVCGVKNSSDLISKQEILDQLNEKIISCKDVTFRIFGLSLTSINMALSLLIILVSIKAFLNYEKIR
tara:strand:- start:706 stop:1191 length:486 start_codon:yes stop_codon:yes gene_type:complete